MLEYEENYSSEKEEEEEEKLGHKKAWFWRQWILKN